MPDNQIDVYFDLSPLWIKHQFSSEDSSSGSLSKNDSKRPDQMKNRQRGQKSEPKPKKNVNFLIDDIDGKNTLKNSIIEFTKIQYHPKIYT